MNESIAETMPIAALTSLCCLGADKSCPVSLEGESCRPEDSLQPPAAAAAAAASR